MRIQVLPCSDSIFTYRTVINIDIDQFKFTNYYIIVAFDKHIPKCFRYYLYSVVVIVFVGNWHYLLVLKMFHNKNLNNFYGLCMAAIELTK